MIYLDYNATTPVDPLVLNEMLPFFNSKFGNPSNTYALGKEAKLAVENAREKVAKLINAKPEEIFFTATGSEANNTVLQNLLKKNDDKKHIITGCVEHPSIMEPLNYLKQQGFQVTYLPVDKNGKVDVKDFESALRPDTCFVTIMHSNNEVGTLQPISEIGHICKKHGIPFHTDASQSLGKVTVDVEQLNVDFLTLAGHKMYAPKGIGALYVRGGKGVSSLIYGAKQEKGLRAGTENVPYIVAIGKAAELAFEFAKTDKLISLKKYFFQKLTDCFGEKICLNGSFDNSLPNTLNISFLGISGNEVLRLCDEIYTSTGSACHSGTDKPSAVLICMGIPEKIALGAVRFSVGRCTTESEIDQAVNVLKTKLNGKI